MSSQFYALAVTLLGSIIEDPLVMIPIENDDCAMRTSLEDVIADCGLPAERCVVELRDLTGTVTDYAFVLPLSLVREAARRGKTRVYVRYAAPALADADTLGAILASSAATAATPAASSATISAAGPNSGVESRIMVVRVN